MAEAKVVSMQDTSIDKVFFNHTSKFDIVKAGYGPVATIAVQLTPDGQGFRYGISICCDGDNFCKATGREIAQARMESGFGHIDMPKPLADLSNRQKCLTILFTLTESVICNPRKWRNRASATHPNERARA